MLANIISAPRKHKAFRDTNMAGVSKKQKLIGHAAMFRITAMHITAPKS